MSIVKKNWLKKSAELFLKSAFIAGALFLILNKFRGDSYQGVFTYTWKDPFFFIPAFLLLWALNLLMDAIIWKRVSAMEEPIGLRRAFKTNFVCYALAFVTPANSGELAGRYLMLGKNTDRKKTLFLTFWSHYPRMTVKAGLGITSLVGLAVIGNYFPAGWMVPALAVILGLLFFIYFRFAAFQKWLNQKTLGRFALGDYLRPDRPGIPLKVKLLLLASLKYLTYNFQFIILVLMWGSNEFTLHLLFSVLIFFFLTAIIPTLAAADFLIKGALALYIFDPALGDQSLWINVSFCVWLFNVALPAFFGTGIILKTDLLRAFKAKFSRGNLYGP